MKIRQYIFFLVMLFSSFSLLGFEKGIYLGPHFNYINVAFDTPSNIDGYAGGITTGAFFNTCYFDSRLNFEGTWNASKIIGDSCDRSNLAEYYLNLEIGKSFTCGCLDFFPYTGFGWDRFENIQEPCTIALRYKYDKLFLPIGFYLNWKRICDSFSLQFEFRPDVWSNLHFLSISLDPNWGYAFRLQGFYSRYIKICSRCITLSWVPFFDWNRYGKITLTNSSDAIEQIPSLTRWNLGLRAILEYSF